MVTIRKKKVKAYILLESLVALGIFASIVSLVLSEINLNRKDLQANLHRQEVLNVANMAVQTGQDSLTLNGVSVRVVKKGGQISVYDNEKLLLQAEKE